MQTSAVERFLRYVTFDTQSSETSDTYPSTEKQLDLRIEGVVDGSLLIVDANVFVRPGGIVRGTGGGLDLGQGHTGCLGHRSSVHPPQRVAAAVGPSRQISSRARSSLTSLATASMRCQAAPWKPPTT